MVVVLVPGRGRRGAGVYYVAGCGWRYGGSARLAPRLQRCTLQPCAHSALASRSTKFPLLPGNGLMCGEGRGAQSIVTGISDADGRRPSDGGGGEAAKARTTAGGGMEAHTHTPRGRMRGEAETGGGQDRAGQQSRGRARQLGGLIATRAGALGERVTTKPGRMRERRKQRQQKKS